MKNAPGALMEATNGFYGKNWPYTMNLRIFLEVLGSFLFRPNRTSRYSYVGERKPIITDFYTTVEGLD